MGEIEKHRDAEPPLYQAIKDADFMVERVMPQEVAAVRQGRVTAPDGTIDDYQEIKFRRRRS